MAGKLARSVMLGGGNYDRNSALQAGVVRLAAGRLEQAVRALASTTQSFSATQMASPAPPLCLVDYGSATGKNAIAAMTHVGALFAEHRPGVPLSLGFCDQPENDWRALASHLHDAFASRDDVTVAMLPRSFYGPVLAAGSVDLGWSAIAVHWLSERPGVPIEHLWPHAKLGPKRAPFSERAGRDWKLFLHARARELRQGGQLVVVAACSRDDGTSTADDYLDVPWEVLGELERAGDLLPDERGAMHVPTYFRSAAEWKAPFADSELGLELRDYGEDLLPDGLWEAFERSGDRHAFAAAWVGWLRAFSEPLLAAALSPTREPEPRRALLDELYRRTTERIAHEPERARIPWTLAVLHASKA